MTNEHPYTTSWEHEDLRVIDCNRCGYKHLYPLPTKADLKDIYENKFGGQLRSGFVERKQSDSEYWQLAFNRRLLSYGELLNNESTRPLRILDVGCGTGNLLSYFRAHDWDIQGIEPSNHFIPELDKAHIPNIPKLVEDISDSEWREIGKFDVINMSMFLEHVLDPFSIVSKLAKNLTSGGILTIESPNDFNAMQMLAVSANEIPKWWINQLHLNYFDFESLESLVMKAGLQPCARDAQFPLEFFLLFGEQYVGNQEIGRTVHMKRVAFEQSFQKSGEELLLHKLYKSFATLGLGRTSIVHSRKI